MKTNLILYKIDYKNYMWLDEKTSIDEKKINKKENQRSLEKQANKKINELINSYEFNKIYSDKQNIHILDNENITFLDTKKLHKEINNSHENFLLFNCYNATFISITNLIEDLSNSLGNHSYISIPSVNTNESYAELYNNRNEYSKVYKDYIKYLAHDTKIYEEYEFQNTTFLLINKNTINKFNIDFNLPSLTVSLIDWFYKLRSSSLKSATKINHLLYDGGYIQKIHISRMLRTHLYRNWYRNYLHNDNFFLSTSYQFSNIINNKKIEELNIKSDESILYITTPIHWTNGMTKHVYDLVNNIKNKHIYIFSSPDNPRFSTQYSLYHYYNGVLLNCEYIYIPSGTSISDFNNTIYLEIFENILISKKIGLVHSHITAFGHSLQFVNVCEKLNIPSYISLHDLYYLGGEYTQLDVSKQFDEEVILKKYHIYNLEEFKINWTKNVQNLFNKVNKIISFNNKYYDILNKFYNIDETKFKLIEHGSNFEKRYKLSNTNISSKLKVIYFGRIREEKGLTTLIELAKQKTNYTFYIVGTIDDLKLFNKLLKLKNIIYYGSYSTFSELTKIVQIIKPHIKIIPALWEEAFNFTLSESYILGLIPLVSKMGALESRTITNKSGFMYEPCTKYKTIDGFKYPTNISDLINILNKIENLSLEEWNNEIEKVYYTNVQTNDQMIKDYLETYNIKKFINNDFIINKYVQQTISNNNYSFQYLSKYYNSRDKFYKNSKTNIHISRHLYNFAYYIKSKI